MPRSLFLTGGGGYVGRRLLERLPPEMFARVVCLARHRGGIPGELVKRHDAEIVTGDLLDPSSYRDRIPEGSLVAHLAAVTGKASRSEYFRVNDEGTRDLVAAAAAASAAGFFFMSSIAAKFPDQTGYHYGRSKQRAEEHVVAGGVPYTVLRPAIILGPGAPVLEGLVKMAGAPVVPLFGGGAARVQPVLVDDLVGAVLVLLERERLQDDLIELGGPDVVTMRDLLARIRRRRFGRGLRALGVPLRPVRFGLLLAEPLLLPILPLTAGQLATFANDGTAEPSPFAAELGGRMTGLAAALSASLSA